MQLKDTHVVVRLSSSHEAVLMKAEITRHKSLLRLPVSRLISQGQSFSVKVVSVDLGTGSICVSRKDVNSSPK